jgi:hypothetical protein
MKKPANIGGVVFGAVMVVAMLVLVLVIGPGDTTRKGIPVWLLGVVGVPCFAWISVRSWSRPRE